jgi:hypothetical protein
MNHSLLTGSISDGLGGIGDSLSLRLRIYCRIRLRLPYWPHHRIAQLAQLLTPSGTCLGGGRDRCYRDGYWRLVRSHLTLKSHQPHQDRAFGCTQPVNAALYRLFRMGCRFPGQETAPGMGAWAPGPVERGLWVTSPERPGRPGGVRGPPAP